MAIVALQCLKDTYFRDNPERSRGRYVVYCYVYVYGLLSYLTRNSLPTISLMGVTCQLKKILQFELTATKEGIVVEHISYVLLY